MDARDDARAVVEAKVMAVIESAWESHPGYRIDLVPYPGTARVWHGDLLLAESRSALRVLETDHVERLYFPEADIRFDLFEKNEHHSICPFKGEADYVTLTASDPPVENVFWTYRDLFHQVAGLKDHYGVYHEKVRVELETRWPDDPRAVTLHQFPVWGDQADLQRLIDAQPEGENRFVAPGYHERTRNVVEGGQLLAEMIVAAAKTIPDQQVISAHVTFPKAASFDEPIEIVVDPLRRGRTFSSVAVRAEQLGVLVSPGLILMDAGASDVMRDVVPMPDVAGPYESEPYDMRVTGRDLRIVEGAYSPNPDRVGPPELYAWVRFRDNPEELYLRRGLVAQAMTHWTIAAAMRPHPGIGEAQAHVTLSTGIMSVAVAFHDDAPIDQWFLYANRATWSGRGLAQGEGTVFSHDGRLLASYSVQAMVRGFAEQPATLGMDASNAM
jgi:acyl-CoA thioesterase-2